MVEMVEMWKWASLTPINTGNLISIGLEMDMEMKEMDMEMKEMGMEMKEIKKKIEWED